MQTKEKQTKLLEEINTIIKSIIAITILIIICLVICFLESY